MSHTNAWANPSAAGAEDSARMAAFLEERSARPDQLQVNQAVCESLSPHPGERLLEVGSGTGVICRMVAPLVAPGGSVAGVDVSPDFTRLASDLGTTAGLSATLHHHIGRAEYLPYADACFDGAWAARLLLHTDRPDRVVEEMRRVVRPGGRVVLMDWDFDTVAVDHPDRSLTRRLLHWRSDHHGGNNWSGRQLYARAHAAGLYNLRVRPVVVVSHEESSALTQSLWRAAEVARDAGAIAPAEHDAWVSELKTQIAAGHFMASIVYFIVIGFIPSRRLGD